MDKTTDYIAYELRIRSPIPLPLRAASSPDEDRPAGMGAWQRCGGAKSRTDTDVTVRVGATPARLPNPVGRQNRWEAAPSAFLMTVDDEVRCLVTDGRDILVEPLGGSEREMGAFLIGPPFAALLQQRGLTTLHAGAVETETGAVLFAGLSGTGKSTLLGALTGRGYALLSDDLAGVEANADGRFLALPASTGVRLRADSLEALGRRPETFEKVHEKSSKHLMPAARLCTGPTAVRAVCVLETHHRADVDIQPASWIRAKDALLRHTFRKRFLHGLGRQEEHFRTIDEVATQVPVFLVRRPASSFQPHVLAERIMAHLESDAGARPPPRPRTIPPTRSSLRDGDGTPETAVSRRRKMRRKLIGGLHGRGTLSEQVEAVLRRRLAADPNDAGTLLRLGDLHRSEGRLDAALDACRRVVELAPGHPKALWLCAVLGGEDLPDAPQAQDVWPAPFVRVRSFLPPDEHQALLASILASREHFNQPVDQPALAGAGYADPKAQNDFKANGRIAGTIRRGFKPRLRKLVGKALPRLEAGGLGAYHMSLQVRAYLAGEFYAGHTDFDIADPTPRAINYVYFLHRQPRAFSGGSLLLHDGVAANTFTRIEPLDNSIVLFPSHTPRDVTVVEYDPGDFGATRFSVNGALRKLRADGG